MSWLPPRPEEPGLAGLTPWLPTVVERQYGDRARSGGLSYVVVDEMDEDVAGLVISPWPAVDDRGRVRFAEEDADAHLAVPLAMLTVLLDERRVVAGRSEADKDALRARPVRIGDVFAAQLSEGRRADADAEHVDVAEDVDAWFDGTILDITAQGLELARMQASAAAAGAVDERFLEHVGAELRGEDPPDAGPPAAPDRNPPRGGAPAAPAADPPGGRDASAARRRASPRLTREPPPETDEKRAEILRRIRAWGLQRKLRIARDLLLPPTPETPAERPPEEAGT